MLSRTGRSRPIICHMRAARAERRAEEETDGAVHPIRVPKLR